MKSFTTLLTIAAAAFAVSAHADATLKIEGVHNCCGKCEKGIVAAVASVPGASAVADKTTVTITAKSDADAKKAADALGAAGYYGKGIDAPITADSAKATTASVENVHLCCPKCADAANKAAKSVTGVTKSEATKGAKTFTVEGDFSKADLAAALQKNGFNATVK